MQKARSTRATFGLNSYVIVDGCRGIELQFGDIAHALEEMKDAGTVLLKSSAL